MTSAMLDITILHEKKPSVKSLIAKVDKINE
jgi:hypothetical protein